MKKIADEVGVNQTAFDEPRPDQLHINLTFLKQLLHDVNGNLLECPRNMYMVNPLAKTTILSIPKPRKHT